MDNSFSLYQVAVDSGEDSEAKTHMADYLNYKEMYDSKSKSS